MGMIMRNRKCYTGKVRESDWKKLNGNTFPANFKELLIEANTSSADRTSYTINILSEMLDDTYKVFRHGMSQSASSYQDFYIQVKKTGIGSYGLRVNGTIVTSTLNIYYR